MSAPFLTFVLPIKLFSHLCSSKEGLQQLGGEKACTHTQTHTYLLVNIFLLEWEQTARGFFSYPQFILQIENIRFMSGKKKNCFGMSAQWRVGDMAVNVLSRCFDFQEPRYISFHRAKEGLDQHGSITLQLSSAVAAAENAKSQAPFQLLFWYSLSRNQRRTAVLLLLPCDPQRPGRWEACEV